MSSKNSSISEKNSFIERFVEVCGTSQAVEITQLLNISYQAAKNYLQGRYPDTRVLKTISEKTSYSINWLLTGEGEKFVKKPLPEDTLLLSDQMRAFIRQVCLEVISEAFAVPNAGQEKTIVLTSENIKQEKVMDKSAVLSENKSK